ncbi:MAG: hypothetical protein PF637_14220 [Spirochaetes bacterium]|jgi:hypothetical protein|nr:hypothetical protein [Spirochaetota bacterium]
MSVRKKYILTLLRDTHSAFYTGNFVATIVLCGMMLEAMLHLKVKNHFKVTKCIEYTRSAKSPVITLKDEDALNDLQFIDMIGVCHCYKYLSNELSQDLRNIHKIRNTRQDAVF